jgi:hypothetical protein
MMSPPFGTTWTSESIAVSSNWLESLSQRHRIECRAVVDCYDPKLKLTFSWMNHGCAESARRSRFATVFQPAGGHCDALCAAASCANSKPTTNAAQCLTFMLHGSRRS